MPGGPNDPPAFILRKPFAETIDDAIIEPRFRIRIMKKCLSYPFPHEYSKYAMTSAPICNWSGENGISRLLTMATGLLLLIASGCGGGGDDPTTSREAEIGFDNTAAFTAAALSYIVDPHAESMTSRISSISAHIPPSFLRQSLLVGASPISPTQPTTEGFSGADAITPHSEDRFPCDNEDGFYYLSGGFPYGQAGRVTIRYIDCYLDNEYFDGTVLWEVVVWDTQVWYPAESRLEYTNFRYRSEADDILLSGSIHSIYTSDEENGGHERVVYNLRQVDYKLARESISLPVIVDYFYETSVTSGNFSANIEGTISIPPYGEALISTESPLLYQRLWNHVSPPYPVDGGALVIQGKANGMLVLLPEKDEEARPFDSSPRISLDVDDDGRNEAIDVFAWDEVFGENDFLNFSPFIQESGAITHITYGEIFTYDVLATDPEGQSLSYRIHHGPSDMRIDGQNRIVWKSLVPLFGDTTVVGWGVEVSDGVKSSLLEGQITISNSNTPAPWSRTGVFQRRYSDLFISEVGDFDLDGRLELLLVNPGYTGNVSTVEFDGSRYVQDWSFPFTLHMHSGIGNAAAGDLDGDGVAEILICDEYGLTTVDGQTRQIRHLYPTGDLGCTTVTSADVDHDGIWELAISHRSFDWKYDVQTTTQFMSEQEGNLEIVWTMDESLASGSLAFGELDGTPSLELVALDSGAVFDPLNGSMEWRYRSISGRGGRLADLDGDNIQEIIEYTAVDLLYAPFIYRMPTRTALELSDLYFRNALLFAADHDSDGRDEVAAINPVSSYFIQIDPVSGDTSVEATFQDGPTQEKGRGYVTGDLDNDGELELAYSQNAWGVVKQESLVVSKADGSLMREWTSRDNTRGALTGRLYYVKDLDGSLRFVRLAKDEFISSYSPGYYVASAKPGGTLTFSTQELFQTEYRPLMEVGDVDADGREEVIVASKVEGGGRIVVMDAFDDRIESTASTQNRDVPLADLAVMDITGDGAVDILLAWAGSFASESRILEAYDGRTQELLWSQPLDPWTKSLPMLAPFPDDSRKLLVVSVDNMVLFRLDSKGARELKVMPEESPLPDGEGVVIGDFDSDGRLDIFLAPVRATGGISRWDEDLNFVNTFLPQLSITGEDFYNSIVAIQLEETGTQRRNLLVLTNDSEASYVNCINPADGSFIWRSPPLQHHDLDFSKASLHAGDFDSDGEPEVLYSSENRMSMTY